MCCCLLFRRSTLMCGLHLGILHSNMFCCGKMSVCLCNSGVLSKSVMSVSELLRVQCKGTVSLESCVSLLSLSFSILCCESLSK